MTKKQIMITEWAALAVGGFTSGISFESLWHVGICAVSWGVLVTFIARHFDSRAKS